MADNREMWQNLGMDLETHDQLCAVLPTAFGDVYLSQENRPAGMAFYDFVVSDIHGIRPAELIELQKQGGKVFGTFCVYVPDEVVVACGGAVTGLCGGSQFWVPDGEKVLPSDMCPLVKASLGAHFGKTCPYFSVADMYVGETTCEGIRDSGRRQEHVRYGRSPDEARERYRQMGRRNRRFREDGRRVHGQ